MQVGNSSQIDGAAAGGCDAGRGVGRSGVGVVDDGDVLDDSIDCRNGEFVTANVLAVHIGRGLGEGPEASDFIKGRGLIEGVIR